jgi:hypothetical protein
VEQVDIASVVSVLSLVLVVSFLFVSLVSIVVFRSCIPQVVVEESSPLRAPSCARRREGRVSVFRSRAHARYAAHGVDIRVK